MYDETMKKAMGNFLQQRINDCDMRENAALQEAYQQFEEAMQTLKSMLNTAQEKIIETARNIHSRIKIDLENTRRTQVENSRKLELEKTADRAAYLYLEQNKHRLLGDVALTLKNGDAQEKRYTKALQEEQSRLQGKIANLKTNIEKAMTLFQRDFPNEVHDADDTIDSLPEYYRMLDQLQKDDLPKYETEFKDRLSSQMMNQIVLFHASLRQQYDQVKHRMSSCVDMQQSVSSDWYGKRIPFGM